MDGTISIGNENSPKICEESIKVNTGNWDDGVEVL